MNIMAEYELLSKAIDLSYKGRDKEAWETVYKADALSDKDDAVYNNLRDAVCLTLAVHKTLNRRAVKK